ncbi:MAG: succinyl-diaminopimelate desuccinylase [Pseudorhodobacter sp.]|jgi:succinyl-diaminopimelate desuccinylase
MRNASVETLDDEEMHADLAALIGFDTCFPPAGDYTGFCALVERLAADLGGHAERIEVPQALWRTEGVYGARVNLLLRPALGPKDAPEALIYFHSDTAPVGDGWTRPALTLTRDGDRLFGRGTADMKGCIAAVFAALRRLKAEGKALRFRPVLAFCTDEEGGLYPGIRYLAETMTLPEVLLNLNGSAAPRIWGGCFGSMDFAITGQGRAVHSGRPDSGVNALEEMVPVLTALAKLKDQVEARTSAMPPPPGEAPLRARLSVTAMHAGDKGSALPGSCRMVVNRRYAPEEGAEAVKAEIKLCVAQALRATRLVDWSIAQIGHLPPVADPDGPWTGRWTDARAQAFGLPVNAFTKYGSGTSSDFGWVQNAGVRHMLLGGLMRPDNNVHGPDEFTTTSDLNALAEAVMLFLSDDFHPDPTRSPDQQGFSKPNKETTQ